MKLKTQRPRLALDIANNRIYVVTRYKEFIKSKSFSEPDVIDALKRFDVTDDFNKMPVLSIKSE